MKKKMAVLLLTLTILGLAAGCGDNKEDTKEKTDTSTEQAEEEEFVLTNKDGKVVAIDVKDLEQYITLGEYKNLEVSEAPKTEVTDEDTEASISNALLNATPVEVTEDRAVKTNDTVNIDYTGYLDGEEFEGGSAQGDDLRIGSGLMISGFEDGLIGHKKGEEVTVEATFPDDYREESLQGKVAEFKVKINKISEPPKLTDEWAAENTDYKTADEFKAAQKELLQKSADLDYESQVKSDLFTLVVDSTEFKEYPKDILEEAKTKVRNQLDAMYQAQAGVTLDEYIEQQGITDEETDEALTSSAQSYMKQNLVVQGILNAEGVELTEKDYEQEEQKFAELNGFPDVETMESYYSDLNSLKESVLWNKACDIIMGTATITQTEETSDTEVQE